MKLFATPASVLFWTAAVAGTFSSSDGATAETPLFQRISTFNVCKQMDPLCDTDTETNAETIWYYQKKDDDGSYGLVYTDAEHGSLGFVDISDPSDPKEDGAATLSGEPTTVRVIGDFAVVGVNESQNYVNPTGKLLVIDLASKMVVTELKLPGQPDAVDITKTSSGSASFPYYIAVAIENERDEDLGDGAPPQLPAGLLTIVTIASEEALTDPNQWSSRDVPLTGLANACRFPEDPEPEYVAIHPDNTKVVVSLQENNCNIVVELETGTVLGAFDAGAVSLEGIDTTEDGLILQIESKTSEGAASISREGDLGEAILREPDGISWIGSTNYFATANEGDLDGGSRGWSIVDASNGEVVYDSGTSLEWETAKIGHYPDERSGNKGNEPENVFYAAFPDFGTEYVFVLSERSSVVFVYSIDSSLPVPDAPVLVQILPVGVGPEGITVIPSKNLVAIASEVDARGDKIRSSIALFELRTSDTGVPEYPSLVSAFRDGEEGPPIPFAALSGLAAASPYGVGDADDAILYTVEDSFYKKNRILTIDASAFPAVVTAEHRILDSEGVLTECLGGNHSGLVVDVEAVVNDDDTVNIDPEGIAVSSGGFWIVSEGKGTIGDEKKPFATPNLLLKTDEDAVISECVLLDETFPPQLRFGFEGVAVDGDMVVVAIQRAWGDEEYPRIAVYNTVNDSWKHAFYPLEAPTSLNGGWVGLSDITSLGNGKFLVLERDNQGGPDAAIKSIYSIDLGGYDQEDGAILTKTLVRDLIAEGDLTQTNGQIIEKIEGLTVTSSGAVWINTDNDGVDGSSGESLLMNVGVVAEGSDDSIAITADTSSGARGSFCAEKIVVLATIVSCLAPLFAIVAGF